MEKTFSPLSTAACRLPVPGLIFAFAALLTLLSCSNSVPQLAEQKSLLIFDFSKSASPPVQRLCVFVRPTGEITRIRSIRVENPAQNLAWELSPPHITSLSGILWAGSASLVMQSPDVFPAGEYRLTVTDYNGTSAVSFFTLAYPAKLAAAAEKAVLQGSSYPELTKKYTILYGDSEEILFFGPEAVDNTDPVQIKRRYPAAVLSQTYLEAANGGYAVLFPARHIP